MSIYPTMPLNPHNPVRQLDSEFIRDRGDFEAIFDESSELAEFSVV